MKFGSVCSGIEAASVAWESLGWKAAWFSEIEPFPCAVLKHHYPEVPNHGDMTALPERILSGEVEAPDVFCGGTPCQAFSVAGNRKSLDDARGNLSLTFCEIADAIDTIRQQRNQSPAIIFWENVPGVLNTKDNAFGCFLAELAGETVPLQPSGGRWTDAGVVLGPKRAIAWRVLDAQYFGLAQRRKRIYVVACGHNGEVSPQEALFEWEGLRRDAPQRAHNSFENGEIVGTITTRTGNANDNYSCEVGHCIVDADEKPRWLTPLECERLMGFPDGYTNIPWRKKPESPDGPRYKALGNSWAVPVVRWIGERIRNAVN
jgi:DNA (cytosine-5)-methyltransferase 1